MHAVTGGTAPGYVSNQYGSVEIVNCNWNGKITEKSYHLTVTVIVTEKFCQLTKSKKVIIEKKLDYTLYGLLD
jgi:hypothetical protein